MCIRDRLQIEPIGGSSARNSDAATPAPAPKSRQDVYPRLRSRERGSRRQQPTPSALSATNLPWPLGSLVAIGRLSLVAIKLSLVAMNRQFSFCRPGGCLGAIWVILRHSKALETTPQGKHFGGAGGVAHWNPVLLDELQGAG